jgi:hypothetical protein
MRAIVTHDSRTSQPPRLTPRTLSLPQLKPTRRSKRLLVEVSRRHELLVMPSYSVGAAVTSKPAVADTAINESSDCMLKPIMRKVIILDN